MARKLYNPTDKNLGYWWDGEYYEVPAGKEVSVEDDFLARHLLAHQPSLVDTTSAPVYQEKPKEGTKKEEKKSA